MTSHPDPHTATRTAPPCLDCPRRCGADRVHTLGYCNMPRSPVVARAALHFDEEPVLSGTRGSGTVFFSGCSLRCVYCQNEPISHGGYGKDIGVSGLVAAYHRLIGQDAHNINLVNPTHFLSAILESLKEPLPVPVVWNSGGYERAASIERLEGKVTVFLPDLKYVDGAPAFRYSGAVDYFRHASKAILEMHRQQPEVVIGQDGTMQRGVMVRHLILPGQAEASMRALDWIKEHLPGAWVSLMAQYTPMGRASDYPEIDRRLSEAEYERVAEHLMEIGLEDGFVQELGSADERYTPSFDLTGV